MFLIAAFIIDLTECLKLNTGTCHNGIDGCVEESVYICYYIRASRVLSNMETASKNLLDQVCSSQLPLLKLR